MTSKRSIWFSVLLLTLLLAGKADATEVLFNGENFDGWDGDPRFWSVVDGAIVGETTEDNKAENNTFLVCRGRDFADFELSFLYQVKGFNSGVQYRSTESEKWMVTGYQADFEDRCHESDHGLIDKFSGMFYEENGRGFLALRGEAVVVRSNVDAKKPMLDKVARLGDPAELEKLVHRDGWNEYRILAHGFQFTHIINGRVMAICVDNDIQNRRSSGVIAFQLHSGPPMRIRVKDVKIQVIEAE